MVYTGIRKQDIQGDTKMLSVRKLGRHETLGITILTDRRMIHRAPLSPTWAVVNEAGHVVRTQNLFNEKRYIAEMHPTKRGAQSSADYLNGPGSETKIMFFENAPDIEG